MTKFEPGLVTPEDFMRDQERRVRDQADRFLIDAIGRPLRAPDFGMGTFSNRPETPAPDFDSLLRMSREFSPALRAKKFEFGAVSVTGFWLSVEKVTYTDGELVITSIVPDRNTGKPIAVTFTTQVTAEIWDNGDAAKAHSIRAAIRGWLVHEIDEHIYVNGEREYDPHKPIDLSLQFPFEIKL